MPFRSCILALLCLGGGLAPAQELDVIPSHDVKVHARDGVALATDIYRPARGAEPLAGRLPALLHRTPYNKRGERLTRQARFFASNGYVVAIQDMRGRFASEGVFSKYHDFDAVDGYDTVEWLARRPYVDGRVGMWGTSYGAHTQADAAKLDPPGLAALALNQGGMANAWDHAVRHGGGFELARELSWAFRYIPIEVADDVGKKAFAQEKIDDWYEALPLRPGLSPLALAPNFEAYFFEEWYRSDYEDFWKRIGRNWAEYYEETADVPMLHIGGWYDIFLRGTIQSYQSLDRLKSSPMHLLIGPWNHGGNARSFAGDVDFGPDSAITDFHDAFHLEWFDHVLRERSTRFEKRSPVRLFVMGGGDGRKDDEGRLRHGGYWLDADAWPLPEARNRLYYLYGDGSLRTEPPGAAESATTFAFDPKHPVPTIGGSVSSRVHDGAYDQRERQDFAGSRPPYLPLRARADVVVFQTEPLPADVVVVGPIEVKLFVSSSAVDTDFTAKLIDVYPPSEDFPSGFDMNLTDALVRMSYRGGLTERQLIEPGEVYEIAVEPFPTANVFKKGHRIRVDISSSNFPRFDVNPNTGDPPGRHRRFVVAENSIHHHAARASHIVLPILVR